MERRWDSIDLNSIPQLKYEVGLEFCDGFTDWSYNDDSVVYQHVISTSPEISSFDPNIRGPLTGTQQSDNCTTLTTLPSPTASSPTSCSACPPQIEKRRAQNRASQRAFRQRQACHIRELEQELDEVRTKYEKLRKYFEQVKVVVCEVEKEDEAGDCVESCSERVVSGDEKKRTHGDCLDSCSKKALCGNEKKRTRSQYA